MTVDRGLLFAIGASLGVHALALGLGRGPSVAELRPPQVLDARLVAEAPPERHVPSPPDAHKPSSPPSPPVHALPKPIARQLAPVEPVIPRHRLTAEAKTDAVPVIASAPVSMPAPLAQAATTGAALSASASSPAIGASVPAAPSYSPPSFGAAYLDNPKPSYPLIARRRGVEGTVKLDVRVSAEGIPTAVKVRESAGHEALDEAAMVAVWHWKFKPAQRGGMPVEASVVVPIRFRLGGDEAG